ncbi:MAG: twin-arginine translocase TatA/TatE family subunit [Phycisphaerales bacterium]|nr:twin-arginine translocase TatA/TatE family subunit [Phycisphaerales bacterium]
MHTLAFGIPGGYEWVLILMVGLLLFGKRLPEVGRSVGRAIVEFKKGVRGIEDEIDDATAAPPRSFKSYDKGTLPDETVSAPQRSEATEQADQPAANPQQGEGQGQT